MDKNFVCECGETTFWYFGDKVRCPNCHNEYIYNPDDDAFWLRRFNIQENKYNQNMEFVRLNFGGLNNN